MQAASAVVVGLVVTLATARFKIPLGVGFLCGAATMGLLSGLGAAGTMDAFLTCFASRETWVFVLVVMLVFALSASLRHAGSLDVLVQASFRLVRNRRMRVACLPALVGLLPMPGGAVVSAPMVDSTAGDLDDQQKNLINYWFRHIWEVFWPLYPGILLAASILGSPVALLCVVQMPLGLLLAVLGYVFILRAVPGGRDEAAAAGQPQGRRVRAAIAPLVVVIAGMPSIGWLLSMWMADAMAGQADLACALVLGLACVVLSAGSGPVIAAFAERRTWSLLALAGGVKLFGDMVTATGAATETAELIEGGWVPDWIAIVALPLFIGLVSGNTIVVVTVVFPVLFLSQNSMSKSAVARMAS